MPRSQADIALLQRFADGRDTAADRAALSERLRAYLGAAAGGVTLDAAFGVATPAGQLPWWRVQALEARDAALRALATRFYAGVSTAAQASAIRKALVAYASSSWRFDRRSTSPPPHYLGTEREMLFDALAARDVVPSARQLRRILRP